MVKVSAEMVMGCSEGEEGNGDDGDGVCGNGSKAGTGSRGGDRMMVIVGTGDWGNGSVEIGSGEGHSGGKDSVER